ncbi:MAG: imidazole glycerol phosphate synthase subunit HisF [Bacteroidetes bacterium]|nr:MAG: imidazole glycerol phosphate synthase subunit HisF [Bacteroidota bacterium]MBL1145610.1 imidazole glycerol phosphate synthase subunit HisF [Bacteroidota bacterium]NOG58406.1 imidazole glycerol phosphate synthase subunit HisF [Bacteroidota bacterium]
MNRLIPVLTMSNSKLVKTRCFKKPNYIGDPINAVKIFNDKMVDEIILLDITATNEGREPNYAKIEEICSEAFMPFAYGGGVRSLDQIQKLFQLGIEKVVLNSILAENLGLVKEAVAIFGSQSIIASVDVKKNILGKYYAYTHSGTKKVKMPIVEYIQILEKAEVGEIFLNSINRDGTYKSYDLNLIKLLSELIDIPLVACGGAGELGDFKKGIEAGASAVSAGSFFIYKRPHQAVLISYPTQKEISILNFNK